MIQFKLPPPPPTNDFSSPAWQDWFYKLGKQVTTNLPDTDQMILSGEAFMIHLTNPLPITSTSSDKENILSGQIFGS